MLNAGYGSGHFQEKKRGKLYFNVTFSKYIHWRRRVLISQTNNELLCIILVIHTFYPSCFSEGEGGIIYFINFCNKIINPYNFLRPHGSKVWNKLKKTSLYLLAFIFEKKNKIRVRNNLTKHPSLSFDQKADQERIPSNLNPNRTPKIYLYFKCLPRMWFN